MKCTAKKTDGKTPCNAYAIKGKDKCRVHGGVTPIKHGLYSKYLPPSLKQKIEDAKEDPDTRTIGTQVLFLTGLLMELLSEVQSQDRDFDDETVNSLLKISQGISSAIEKDFRIKMTAGELITGERIGEFIQTIVLTLKRIVNDESIPRRSIPAELAKRIGRAARLPGIATSDS